MTDTSGDITVDGPVVDEETGVLYYTARLGDRETSFGVIPHTTREGITRWVMRLGPDRAVPGDFSVEPYETPEAALEAGLRAARAELSGERA